MVPGFRAQEIGQLMFRAEFGVDSLLLSSGPPWDTPNIHIGVGQYGRTLGDHPLSGPQVPGNTTYETLGLYLGAVW